MLANAVCQICTDTYDAEKPVAAMPCGHTFHDDCLCKWLANTRNCPTCRKPLKKTQHPIHRLFFSFDTNCSQRVGSPKSPRSQDPIILEKNRKLQAQLSALQAAISKLKSECQEAENQKVALSCALSDKNSEIQTLGRNHEKLRRKLREFTTRQNELEDVRTQLAHLHNVQTVVDGVESEVKQMLEEKAGYTPQQLTYVVLLRQQLDNSKRSNEKLKREITEHRDKLVIFNRKCGNAESEMELLKLELKRAETRNITLKKKCDMLIKSMNSPQGAAASLAKRVVHQSPMPDFVTPPALFEPANRKRNRERSVNQTSTPAWASSTKEKPPVTQLDTSSDLFNESSAFTLSDVTDDLVKQTLDFLDEDMPHKKKARMGKSKELLTEDSNRVTGEQSASQPSHSLPFKPKSSLKLKNKPKLKPINPAAINSQVRDVTNLLPPTTCSNSTGTRQTCFRQGFDGMGGQSSVFNRTHNAMQFNVFKKPTAVKSKSKSAGSSQQQTIDTFIVLE